MAARIRASVRALPPACARSVGTGQESGEFPAYWLHIDGFLLFEATRGHPRFQALKQAADELAGPA